MPCYRLRRALAAVLRPRRRPTIAVRGADLFLKSARLALFESYCRIHERIDLQMLADKLGMEQIAAEKWIVNMVSNAQLNAKIDSQSGHVILGVQPPDVYQQVIEKTKGLSFRSYVLAQNIEKRSNAVAASAD
jgi:translation initiation factor 3 subunit E